MKMLTMILALTIAAPLAFTACDRTVEEKVHTSTDDNGKTKVDKKVVTETPNGDKTVTEEKKTVDPH